MSSSELTVLHACQAVREALSGLSEYSRSDLSAEVQKVLSELSAQLARLGASASRVSELDPEVDEVDPDDEVVDAEDLEDSMASAAEVAAAVEYGPRGLTIDFVSQQDGALKRFALSTQPLATAPTDQSDIALYDIEAERVWSNWRTVEELHELIGVVVWANLTEYKLGHGYRAEDVLLTLGISGPWGSRTWKEAAEAIAIARGHGRQ